MNRYVGRTATRTPMGALTVALWLAASGASHAQEVISRTAAGATPAAIQPTLDFLRQKLGGSNNGTGGTYLTGRREITWDEVPDDHAAPGGLDPGFFNSVVPRGLIIRPPRSGQLQQVSMDDNAGNDPDPDQMRFDHIRFGYSAQFQAYSGQRMYSPISENVSILSFLVPGTGRAASVRGLGVVFSDVDIAGATTVEFFDPQGIARGTVAAPVGAYSAVVAYEELGAFDIAFIRMTTGNAKMGATESATLDVVAMDDMIFGEPQASRFELTTTFARAIESAQPTIELTITRRGWSFSPAAVTVTGSSSATANADYVLPTSTVQFAIDETVKTIQVQVKDDALREGLETARFTLTSPTNDHVIGLENHADVLIVDDEVPPPGVYGTTTDNHLVRFNVIDAGSLTLDVPITGLAANEIVVALDARPQDGLLYGVGSSSRLYRITPGATAATAVPVGPGSFTPALIGTSFGADFDPVRDQLRVVSDAGLNLRLDPATGRVVGGAADGALAFAAGDPHQGASPKVGAVGYVNSVAGASTTTAYAIETTTASLVKMDPAQAGTLRTVASLRGLPAAVSLDIQPGTNLAFLIASPEPTPLALLASAPQVAIVDLTTGRINPVSGQTQAPPANGGASALAAATPPSLLTAAALILSEPAGPGPDPNSEQPTISAADATVTEGDAGTTTATVTLTLSKAATAEVSVSYATADGTATANADYTPASGTVTFAAGVLTRTIQVPVVGDTLVEGPHAFAINLSAPTNATIGDGQALVSITDNDTAPPTYVFAEGATGPFFDLDILLANPHATPAPVTLTFLKEDATTVTHQVTLAPTSRATVRVDEIPGLEATAVSTLVTSTSGLALVAERTMRWDASGYGAHTEKAVEGSALTWYFAEGSQGFFSTYLLLVNPGATTNTATVTYLREGDTPVTRTYEIAPRARYTVDAGEDGALRDRSFGMNVTFAQPGVAERAMYFGRDPLWRGGHESAGIVAPATEWFLAEGATGAYFDTFVLLSNPQPTPAEITLTFLLASGPPIVKTKTIPASGRLTVYIEAEDTALADVAVGTRVVSSVPIIVERAQYWPFTPDRWAEAHNTFGVTSLGTSWGLAEGRTGGPLNAQTYILLANPGPIASTVTIAFLRTNGTTVTKTFTVPPASRLNVATGAGGPVPELVNEEFAAVITATQPIAVERSMYLDAGGEVWAAGTNATASRLP